MLRPTSLFALCCVLFACDLSARTVTTMAELVRDVDGNVAGTDFALRVRVLVPTIPERTSLYVEDETGSGWIGFNDKLGFVGEKPGDMLSVTGTTIRCAGGFVGADCLSVRKTSGTRIPVPIPVCGAQLEDNRLRGRLISVEGSVREIFRDEIDPLWVFVFLNCQGVPLCATIADGKPTDADLKRLVGATVRVRGIRTRSDNSLRGGQRRMLRHTLSANGMDSLAVVRPFDEGWDVLPDIASITTLEPAEINRLDRHRTSGRVLAAWEPECALLRTPDGEVCRLSMAEGPTPPADTCVEAAGFPETDLYRINLANARWKTTHDLGIAEPPAVRMSAHDIFTDAQGRQRFFSKLHGQAVTLTGHVPNLPAGGNGNGRLRLTCDGCSVDVDFSAAPGVLNRIQPGSQIETTGVCVLETDQSSSAYLAPRITSVLLVIRRESDVVLLQSPSWWTPVRLLVVIGILLVAILAVLAWNVSLRRLAERRGRMLAAGDIARAEADIKTMERTRLSVELHDALSQTLTGVAMELETANQVRLSSPADMVRHLDRARQTIGSCRTELKNCLWDLRNDALEEPDMNRAIRLTLMPYAKDVNVRIRVMVPRERFTDSSMHAILRIIRELSVNAINHGHATELQIAGSIEGDTFKFSVADNGTGFDPDSAPGVAEGHFGLEGVRERVRTLHGRIDFTRAVRGGCKAVVTVKLILPHGKIEVQS